MFVVFGSEIFWQLFPISYSARIVGHEIVKDDLARDHVVYVIEVSRPDSPIKYTVYRRWSKFVMVDKLLESEHGVARTISRFPSFRRGTDESLIRERIDVLNVLLVKFLSNLCPLVSEFLRIPSEEESRYDFSAVTSSVVTSGVQTPMIIDDSDEGVMRKIRHETQIGESCGKPIFSIFMTHVKTNPISLARNQLVGVDFLALVVEKIGVSGTCPTDSMRFLKFLSHIVSAEHNPGESAIAVFLLNHKISTTQWAKANLGYHITENPSPFGNRSDAFRLIYALDKDDLGLHNLGLPEMAVSQYLMWRDRHVTFAEVLPGQANGGDSFVSPGMVSLMGPHSPLAASPARSSRSPNSAAHDAREWLMVSLAALDSDGLFIPDQSSWIKVATPKQCEDKILGEFSLWYRPSLSESQTEVKFEWSFPAHVNMEHVLGLLFNPDEIGTPGLVGNFFGLVSAYSVNHTTEEENILVKKLTAYFEEPKKAVANLILSSGRGVGSNSVVIALASDTSTNRSIVSTHRLIRSFHLGGCEVNVNTGQMKGLINFSSDSIFLVAGDLLGERLVLWRALERFSFAVKELSHSHQFSHDNPMSCWLRSQFPPSSNS